MKRFLIILAISGLFVACNPIDDCSKDNNQVEQPDNSGDSANSGGVDIPNGDGAGEQGNSGSDITPEPTPNPTIYKVGDYYADASKEGVVFWIDSTGEHGKIISLTESVEELLWSSSEVEQKTYIGADDRGNGANNMAVVRNIPDWQNKYPAFKWCFDLGEAWYLPAIDEVVMFALNDSVHNAVNQTLEIKGIRLADEGDFIYSYLSSTEYDYQDSNGYFSIWGVNMSYSGTYSTRKVYDGYVRAVAAF